MKALPYGISDFPRIRCEDYYYVDKRRFIEILERQPPYLFLIRPRRFGKSLFLAMLEAYYSIDYAGRFEELFGELYIGQHPTKRHNSYMVLRFNFSEVSSKLEFVDRSFCEYCCMVMKNFILKYEHLLGSGIWEVVNPDETNPEQMLAALKEYVSRTDCPRIYLLIDEYDNFTNTILSSYGQERYREKTHGEGLIRGFFNNVKASTSNAGAAVERLFITGVSPITMDDVTSGFNIGTNISMLPQFNDIIGFSEDEVREMITYYKDENALPADVTVDELVELMKPWYDNYCFAEASLDRDPKMFNCDMVFYYLRHYMTLGKSPKEMIDPNTRTDYNKMKKLIRLDKLDGNRKGVLRKITEDGQIVTTLTTTFPATDITKPEIFPSLLFYYGMLTITATRGNYLVLSIPNNNVRKQYYEFLLEEYQDNRHINLNDLGLMYYEMAYDGHWRETLEFIAHAYKENSSVRSAIEGERNLQGFFTAYLSTNAYYLIAPEVELNHGYCDLFLMPDLIRYDVKHSYIIELKYLSVKDSEAKAEAQWKEAVEQIKGYAAGPKVRRMIYDTELHCIVMQFRGWELERMEEVR